MLWVSLILFLVLGLKTIISEKICEACVKYEEENSIKNE